MPKMLYEINTAVWLNEQTWTGEGPVDLAEIPDSVIESWKAMGVDIVWFLGVWKIGDETRNICLKWNDIRDHFEKIFPGSVPDHVAGSPFSIADYSLRPQYGNEASLRRLRDKLHAHGIALMLDFVANHMAVDHPWVTEHPERFVKGSERLVEREPGNYFRVPGHPRNYFGPRARPLFFGLGPTRPK